MRRRVRVLFYGIHIYIIGEKVNALMKFLKIIYNATLIFAVSLFVTSNSLIFLGSLLVTSNSFSSELFIIQTKLTHLKRNGDYTIFPLADNMVNKMEKYYNLISVAVILDPTINWGRCHFGLRVCMKVMWRRRVKIYFSIRMSNMMTTIHKIYHHKMRVNQK